MKSFLVDLTRCTACRGCQVACKQWNKLPATETSNWGSHQNPKELNPDTYKLVRFEERIIEEKLHWLFFPEQCRHCVDPPCKAVGDGYAEGAVIQDPDTGAVYYTDLSKDIDTDDPEELCPYNIPRRNPETGIWSKCNMCNDRVKNGLKPACVQVCPTGTMEFGDREDILELAQKRLETVKKEFPKAQLINEDTVNVIYLVGYDPAEYYEYLMADAGSISPRLFHRRQMFAGLRRMRQTG